MRKLVIAPLARRDLDRIFVQSEAGFGGAAARRYRVLVASALRDLRSDPDRRGVVPGLEGFPSGVRLYHLRFSRRRRSREVARPRHFIAFRADDEILTVIRVLFDAMDFAAHLGEG